MADALICMWQKLSSWKHSVIMPSWGEIALKFHSTATAIARSCLSWQLCSRNVSTAVAEERSVMRQWSWETMVIWTGGWHTCTCLVSCHKAATEPFLSLRALEKYPEACGFSSQKYSASFIVTVLLPSSYRPYDPKKQTQNGSPI